MKDGNATQYGLNNDFVIIYYTHSDCNLIQDLWKWLFLQHNFHVAVIPTEITMMWYLLSVTHFTLLKKLQNSEICYCTWSYFDFDDN